MSRPPAPAPLLHLVLIAAVAMAPAPARADDAPAGAPSPAAPPPPPSSTTDEDLAQVRVLFERGDHAAAREILLRAYARDPRPALLFALGQVELNLGHPQAAIDYYERFLATGPGEDEAALAQQAIGAARMQLALPKPPPPSPVMRRRPPRWDTAGTWIAILGGLGAGGGAGLVVYARRLGGDRSGTLSEYDARLDRARRWQWIGAGVAAAGALTVGAALLRWRTSGGLELVAAPTAGGAAATLGGAW